MPLGKVLEARVEPEYFVPESDVPKWKYLKGAKSEERGTTVGYVYRYTEGAIPFPDPIDLPSRTLITSEGGTTPSRFKHLIKDPATGRYRVLTPIECERLNQFPDDWTSTGMPTNWRYFCMGNALVVGLIERMGSKLAERVQDAQESAETSRPRLARAAAASTAP